MHFYSTSSYNSSSKPRYTTRILGRRFAMTAIAYKYMLISIWTFGTLCLLWKCSLVIIKVILPCTTWKAFHRETCWYWMTHAVNRALTIIDSRFDCGTRKKYVT